MKIYHPLSNINSVISILSQISLWGGLTGEQQEKIYQRLEVGTFRKGEYIFRKGDQPSHIYIVKSGKVKLLVSHEDAVVQKETVETGGSFGVAALMAVQTHMATALAAEDTELMVLSREALLGLYHDDIKLFALLMMNIAREIARRLKLTDDILLQYVREHKDR
jgi:CRP/FNR family cyclic AMP-dependent transcriptional regulator